MPFRALRVNFLLAKIFTKLVIAATENGTKGERLEIVAVILN